MVVGYSLMSAANNDEILLKILQNNRDLQLIDFNGVKNETEIVDFIAKNMPNMLEITLKTSPSTPQRITIYNYPYCAIWSQTKEANPICCQSRNPISR